MEHFFSYVLYHGSSYSLTVGRIILSVAMVVGNIILVRVISAILLKRFRSRPGYYSHHYAFVQLIKYVLWTVAIILTLQVLGLDITFIVASSAALLVGLGLGMQIIFKDFMSGIILLVEGTIRIDDIVEVEGQVLKVRAISLRTCEVITRDDTVLIIPNHKFTEENVINWTHNSVPTRFYIDVGVDYSSDPALVEQCLLASVKDHPDVIHDDNYIPFVRFTDFGSSALAFQLIFWSDNLFRIENTKSAIRYDIFARFKANNITIPFSQMVIHQA